MNRDYAETYEEHKSGKYEYVKGFGRLGCYQGLDYIENILKNDKYYSEELEDNFIFIQSYINSIEQQVKKQKEAIDKAIEFTNKNWGTWCSNHCGYMTELQNILKEVSK